MSGFVPENTSDNSAILSTPSFLCFSHCNCFCASICLNIYRKRKWHHLSIHVTTDSGKVVLHCLNTTITETTSKPFFPPATAKPKLKNFPQIRNWVQLKNKQHHSKVMLNSFPTNGHTLGFCPYNQKLENVLSPKVSLWDSKG